MPIAASLVEMNMNYLGLFEKFANDGLVVVTDKGRLWAASILLNQGKMDAALEQIIAIEDTYNRGVGMAYWWEVVNPGKTVKDEFNQNVSAFNWLLIDLNEDDCCGECLIDEC